jgi:8-oxo-dGTP pyrophosphatase MutT (NUDIX family)
MAKLKGHVRRQYAALPFRLDDTGCPEILLVTTRETGRWIVPKGWPVATLSPRQVAAREAYEEAGLIGTMLDGTSFGSYQYDKILVGGATIPCEVKVFAMRVERQNPTWPEMQQRRTRWCNPDLAASLVAEPGLARILSAFPDHLAALRNGRPAAS